MTNQEILKEYQQARYELGGIESAKGNIPEFQYNRLLNFAYNRCDELLDQLYPEA